MPDYRRYRAPGGIGVKSDYGDQLDEEQKDDLRKRLEAAEKTAGEVLVPHIPWRCA